MLIEIVRVFGNVYWIACRCSFWSQKPSQGVEESYSPKEVMKPLFCCAFPTDDAILLLSIAWWPRTEIQFWPRLLRLIAEVCFDLEIEGMKLEEEEEKVFLLASFEDWKKQLLLVGRMKRDLIIVDFIILGFEIDFRGMSWGIGSFLIGLIDKRVKWEKVFKAFTFASQPQHQHRQFSNNFSLSKQWIVSIIH